MNRFLCKLVHTHVTGLVGGIQFVTIDIPLGIKSATVNLMDNIRIELNRMEETMKCIDTKEA